MVLYEQSDVIRWGINLFDGDHGYYPEYYGDAIHYDTGDAYDGHCFPSHYDAYNGDCFHSHYDTECNQVENDEIIARTLQEEFQRLEIAEHSRHSQAEGERFQFHASEPTYDCWHDTSTVNYCSPGIIKGIKLLCACL